MNAHSTELGSKLEASKTEMYQDKANLGSDTSITFNAMQCEAQSQLDKIEPMKTEAQAQYVKLDNLGANAYLRLGALQLDVESKMQEVDNKMKDLRKPMPATRDALTQASANFRVDAQSRIVMRRNIDLIGSALENLNIDLDNQNMWKLTTITRLNCNSQQLRRP